MTVYMDKKDYDKHLALSDEFESCLVECAQEISLISMGRELIGEFNGDIDIYTDDQYLVQFEDWSGCELNTDSVRVPKEYIYDEGYREYYKKVLIRENEIKEAARLVREEQRKAHTYRVITDERATYERLKKKFDGES